MMTTRYPSQRLAGKGRPGTLWWRAAHFIPYCQAYCVPTNFIFSVILGDRNCHYLQLTDEETRFQGCSRGGSGLTLWESQCWAPPSGPSTRVLSLCTLMPPRWGLESMNKKACRKGTRSFLALYDIFVICLFVYSNIAQPLLSLNFFFTVLLSG